MDADIYVGIYMDVDIYGGIILIKSVLLVVLTFAYKFRIFNGDTDKAKGLSLMLWLWP